MHANTVRLAIAVVALALVAAACGGGSAATPDESGTITIELSEFQFSPNTISVKPGQTVTFKLVNVGDKAHEFMIGRDVDTSPGYPNGFQHDFFEGLEAQVSPMDAVMGEMGGDMGGDDMSGGDEHMGHSGLMVVREPNQDATLTVTIPADASGEWQIGCFEEDGAHWDDGMRGTLKIEG